MSQPPIFYKNPAVAIVLSFIFAGLGQLYNGELGKGFGFIAAYVVSILLMSIYIGFITTPLLWILGMVDAYLSATSINEQLVRQNTGQQNERKKCPQCAEFVRAEALLCRFCRYQFPAGEETKPRTGAVAPTGPWHVLVLNPSKSDTLLRELVRARFPGISHTQLDDFLNGPIATIAKNVSEDDARELYRRLESRGIAARLESSGPI